MNKRPCIPGSALFVLLCMFGMLSCTALQLTVNASPVPRPVQDACDAAYTIAVSTPGVAIQRSIGMFDDEALREPVLGCHLVISGSFVQAQDSGDAAERLRCNFGDKGWQNMSEYDADGKDGTRFAFCKAGVTCLFRGEWNGGSDGEPEIPGEDWYRVFVLCTSSVSDEQRRW